MARDEGSPGSSESWNADDWSVFLLRHVSNTIEGAAETIRNQKSLRTVSIRVSWLPRGTCYDDRPRSGRFSILDDIIHGREPRHRCVGGDERLGRISSQVAADDLFVPCLQDQTPHITYSTATEGSLAVRSQFGRNCGSSINGPATRHWLRLRNSLISENCASYTSARDRPVIRTSFP